MTTKKEEIARLRLIITKAPHSPTCVTRDSYFTYRDEKCNCWKAEADGGSE